VLGIASRPAPVTLAIGALAARRGPCYDGVMATEIFPRITIDPAVCFGKPTIRGLRIRVTDILAMLATGATTAEILESYPYLEAEDIPAALAYAAKTTAQPVAFAAE